MTKQVRIDILAQDHTKKAVNSAKKGLDGLKSSVFNLRNAFAGLGLALVARDFINTASSVEQLKIRFKFLFNTAKEGEKAFKNLIKFAGQVPFELQEIQRGAANLAVVSRNAEEMNELLAITGDIAAASGLDFQTIAEQLQRVFSSGIASADLFRERGVSALLGFEQGVQMNAQKSRDHIINAFRDGTLSVQGASGELATSFAGTVSMLQDKFFSFKLAVMDTGPFEMLKAGAQLLDENLSKNFGSVEEAARKIGDGIVATVEEVILGSAMILDELQPLFSFIGKAITGLFKMLDVIPEGMKAVGVIGFLLLGTKGKLLVVFIGGILI